MVIYSHIQTAVSANSEKIKVRDVAEFKALLPHHVAIPYNAPFTRAARDLCFCEM